jgi:hypothetical protein
VRNNANLFALDAPRHQLYLGASESRYGQQGRRFAEEVRNRAPNARLQIFDSQVSSGEMDQALQKAEACDAHVVAAFVSVAAYRGNVGLGGQYPASWRSSEHRGLHRAHLAGQPVPAAHFPDVAAYVATYSPAPTSEVAAAKAILGAIRMTGVCRSPSPDWPSTVNPRGQQQRQSIRRGQ